MNCTWNTVQFAGDVSSLLPTSLSDLPYALQARPNPISRALTATLPYTLRSRPTFRANRRLFSLLNEAISVSRPEHSAGLPEP